MIPSQNYLKEQYINKKLSAKQISKLLHCSENKVHYWLKKYKIEKRSIKDAMYLKLNPLGDPFNFKKPATDQEWFLYGLGIGLYWGEGNKANKHAVRLGNTDPYLIKLFLQFLTEIYCIDNKRLRFGLQIFSDTNPESAKKILVSKTKY